MPETLRRQHTGAPVGEGDRVIYNGPHFDLDCFVDSWSVGAGLVYLRASINRETGGMVYACTAAQVGCYFGFERDALP